MSSNYPPGVTGSEPQIAGDAELDAILDQSTEILRDELDRLAAADQHESQIAPSSIGHAIALGNRAAERDDLRVAILAELAGRDAS